VSSGSGSEKNGQSHRPPKHPNKEVQSQTRGGAWIKWFNAQKEEKYAPKNCIDEGRLALECPTIRDSISELGLGYVFAEPEECNLALVREFYANWDTSFGDNTKIKIQGQVVHFTARSFNAFWYNPF
ncbi:hypothetical protein HAX54_003734, partial [Datura stramonium]|nr:hypothetical protein [Datura stramonium]